MSANYTTILGVLAGTTYDLVVSPENLAVGNNETRLLCNTTDGAIEINLPAIADFQYALGAKIIIVDEADTAATNNITINAAVGNNINNASSYVVSTNGSKIEIFIASKTEYGVLGGAVPASAIISVNKTTASGVTSNAQNVSVTENGTYLVMANIAVSNLNINNTIYWTIGDVETSQPVVSGAVGASQQVSNYVVITDFNSQQITVNVGSDTATFDVDGGKIKIQKVA